MLETLRALLLSTIAVALSAFNTAPVAAAIAAPETVSVAIVRDVFGKPRSITRSGPYGGSSASATRSYVYDPQQRLCKTIEPESGATVQAYDSANNIAWRASGVSLPGTSTCDDTAVPAVSDRRNQASSESA